MIEAPVVVPFPPEVMIEAPVIVPFPPEVMIEAPPVMIEAPVVVPFPPEVMMEILSWLPLKPLTRAQLVCKEWRALIQDHQFMEIHMGNVNASSRNRSNGGADKGEEEKLFLFWNKKWEASIVPFPAEVMIEASVVVPFPPEVMMEILSWLPLKPLTRAQLVCKEWLALIQDHQFMEIHMNRAPFSKYWFNNVSKTDSTAEAAADPYSFTYLHGCDGLLLMRKNINHNATKMHYLWNPAAQLLLDLPPPHIGNYGFALSFVPATQNYKIFSFFREKPSGKYGCQLLTPGTSMEWKPLAFPIKANLKLQASLVPAGGAVHSFVITKAGTAEIISLDVETELVTLNRFPTGIFRDIRSARVIDCDGKLGFAVIVGQELQLMVLEDYKNNRWCRSKRVIPLSFLKDEGFKGIKVVILLIKRGEIWFWLEDQNIFAYTIETGKISDVCCQSIKLLSLTDKLYSYKPSLVTFEGMRREDAELENYHPQNLQLD